MLTTDDFLKMASDKPFSETLAALPHFARGLPSADQLRNAGVATVFRELLVQGSVISNENSNVEFCHCQGWIHADRSSEGSPCYTFPSPLHAYYVSCKLIPPAVQCPFRTVQEMTFAILKKFNRSQLSSPSCIGVAFSERPLEARYQFEFYRGLFAATGGGVRISPELLTAPGTAKAALISMFRGKNGG